METFGEFPISLNYVLIKMDN